MRNAVFRLWGGPCKTRLCQQSIRGAIVLDAPKLAPCPCWCIHDQVLTPTPEYGGVVLGIQGGVGDLPALLSLQVKQTFKWHQRCYFQSLKKREKKSWILIFACLQRNENDLIVFLMQPFPATFVIKWKVQKKEGKKKMELKGYLVEEVLRHSWGVVLC